MYVKVVLHKRYTYPCTYDLASFGSGNPLRREVRVREITFCLQGLVVGRTGAEELRDAHQRRRVCAHHLAGGFALGLQGASGYSEVLSGLTSFQISAWSTRTNTRTSPSSCAVLYAF